MYFNKIFLHVFPVLLILSPLQGQVVYWEPQYPVQGGSVSIYYDVISGTLPDNTGQVYIHHGYNGWTNVNDFPMTYTGNGGWWRFDWNIPDDVTVIDFVFQDGQGNWDNNGGVGIDWHIQVFESGLTAIVISPEIDDAFGDPYRTPVFASLDDTVQIVVSAVANNTQLDSIFLLIENIQVAQTITDTLFYEYIVADYGTGAGELSAVAIDTNGIVDTASFIIMVNPELIDLTPPAGTTPGINYDGASTVTLALFAPYKQFVYVIGDFNDWRVDTTCFMKRSQPSADSTLWWLTIEGLSEGIEYAFQYLVDGEIRIGDPYTDKVLDSWNDPYIPAITYPNLKPYPLGKTREPVSVFQTGQQPFNWVYGDTFQRPPQKDLIVYELLVRDFIARHDFQTLIDSLNYLENLGINAIELMPFSEFEGNSSWGYNPSFYFAPDKYYGTKEALKLFIDECHRRGIAVIMDMVLNHSYGQSPLVRLYWDAQNNRPAAENPWYNPVSPNPVYAWGNDFNHESLHTQAFVDRVNRYWLIEYQVDGFRFDFTKGFTNTPGDGGNYDAARIAILKRMADQIWEADSTAYVILEHFTDNTEERQLAQYRQGMILWGNSNFNYNEATMGWHSNNGSDFSWGYYGTRGWNKPNLVTYMESHDEERLMYKNLQWGNSNGSYNIRELGTALNRIKLAAAFFLTLPGPKMIWQFGELGYDVSINYEDCRVCEKPILWNYFDQENRNKLYKTYAALTRLRNDNEVFRSAQTYTNLWLNSGTGLKRIRLSHSSMKVCIIGNFGVTTQTLSPDFHHTGTWYDYFSGDSITVDNINQQVGLTAGEFHIYSDVRIEPPEPGLLAVTADDVKSMPIAFSLAQNYPNPFNPTTTLRYDLPVQSHVTLVIYDILGRKVRTLVSSVEEPGYKTVVWDATDDLGRQISAGVYLCRISAESLGEGGDFVRTRKMVFLK